MNDKQEAILSDVPKAYRNVYERAYSGQSRAAGIKAFCLYCVGNVRADIRDCTSRGCPLWPYRPYTKGDDDAGAE